MAGNSRIKQSLEIENNLIDALEVVQGIVRLLVVISFRANARTLITSIGLKFRMQWTGGRPESWRQYKRKAQQS